MSSTETEGRSLVPMVGEARVQVQTGMCKEEGTGIGQAQRTVSSSPLFCSTIAFLTVGTSQHCIEDLVVFLFSPTEQ